MELENTKVICVGEHSLHMLVDKNGMSQLKLENGKTCVSIEECEFYDLLIKGKSNDWLHKAINSLVGILEYADRVNTKGTLSIRDNKLILTGLADELNFNVTDLEIKTGDVLDYILDLIVADIVNLDGSDDEEFNDVTLARVARQLMENLVTE